MKKEMRNAIRALMALVFAAGIVLAGCDITAATNETAATLSSITVTAPTKVIYEIGGTLDTTGMVVTAVFSDSTEQTVDLADCTIIGFDSSAVADDQVITVTYDGQTATFTVDIIKSVASIAITTPPDTTTYYIDGELDTTGLVVTATFTDNSTAVVDNADLTFNYDFGTAGTGIAVTIAYGDAGTSFTVTVIERSVQGITIVNEPTNKIYYEAGSSTLSTTGLSVTAQWDEGADSDVTGDVTCSAVNTDISATGTQTVTVTYSCDDGTFTDTFDVTVYALSSIAVTTAPTTTTYNYGSSLDTTGLVVTATYGDSSTAVIAVSSLELSSISALVPGTQAVTATYRGETCSFNVSIIDYYTAVDITSEPTTLVYQVGDSLVTTGLAVSATKAYAGTASVAVADLSITGFDSTYSADDQVVTITCGAVSDTFTVDILGLYSVWIGGEDVWMTLHSVKVNDTEQLTSDVDVGTTGAEGSLGWADRDAFYGVYNSAVPFTMVVNFDVNALPQTQFYKTPNFWLFDQNSTDTYWSWDSTGSVWNLRGDNYSNLKSTRYETITYENTFDWTSVATMTAGWLQDDITMTLTVTADSAVYSFVYSGETDPFYKVTATNAN